MANQTTTPGGGDKPATKATLGLTGLTINAMALIAPGAFLWLTLQQQSLYGAPMAGCAMWFGLLAALLLCFATAISYAELSKLYPGAGSSYLYAEQAFASKTKAFKFARVVKFFTGWASHLYYWVYPGLMVGVTAILCGYLLSQLFPDTFSGTYNSPLFMYLFCIVFSLGIGYIAFRGVTGTTAVNMAINVIQISALIVFSVMAISYRTSHKEGATAIHISNGTAVNYNVDSVNVLDDKGKPVPDMWADNTPKFADAKGNPVADEKLAAKDKDGKPVPVFKQQDRTVTKDDLDKAKNTDAAVLGGLTAMGLADGDPYPVFQKDDAGKLKLDKDGHAMAELFTISYKADAAITGKAGDAKDPLTYNFHTSASSVVSPHGFSYVIIQACIAILLLVGFESVTAMGEEAKDPKKDIGRAVLLSLAIQGAVCYLFEYFAANYLFNSGYTISNAGASGAPLGDMMLIVGTWAFGSAAAGKAFMLIQAFTVFLALVGTTLSCLSTGARVTYAMGRDEEVPSHFGLVHGRTLSPHRAIWTLSIISIFIGIAAVTLYLGGTTPAALDKHNVWYSFAIFAPATYAKMPNTLLIVTLISNFGTFLLYMTTCLVAIVAFKEHHTFSGIKHFVIPIFGLVANLACMSFYLIGPFMVPGMSVKEPYIALGFCALWGIYGLIYFVKRSKETGKEILLTQKPA